MQEFYCSAYIPYQPFSILNEMLGFYDSSLQVATMLLCYVAVCLTLDQLRRQFLEFQIFSSNSFFQGRNLLVPFAQLVLDISNLFSVRSFRLFDSQFQFLSTEATVLVGFFASNAPKHLDATTNQIGSPPMPSQNRLFHRWLVELAVSPKFHDFKLRVVKPQRKRLYSHN